MQTLTLNLFILKDNGSLLTNLQNATPVLPQSLPLYYGDQLTVNVWVLTGIQGGVNPAGNFPYQVVNNAGLAPLMYVTDGTIAGGENPLASCVQWNPDPTNSYVQGTLNLGTPGLLALLGAGKSAAAYLSFGFLQNAVPVTVFEGQVNIGVGVQNVVPALPPKLTPLSVQAANLLYFPLQPVAGQNLYLATLVGEVIELVPATNPPRLDINATGQSVPI